MCAKDNDICEKVADFLIDLMARTKILKHQNGNITLKISLAAYSLAVNGVDGINLSNVLNGFSGIKKYDFSFLWSTLDIHYDTTIIPHDLWDDLISGACGDPSSRTIMKQRLIRLFNGSLREH